VLVAALTVLWLSGESDRHMKWEIASAQTETLAAKIAQFKDDTGRLPASLEELVQANSNPRWLGPYAKQSSLKDPWGVPFHYRAIPSTGRFVLFTLGKDGQVGGTGDNADIQAQPSPER